MLDLIFPMKKAQTILSGSIFGYKTRNNILIDGPNCYVDFLLIGAFYNKGIIILETLCYYEITKFLGYYIRIVKSAKIRRFV